MSKENFNKNSIDSNNSPQKSILLNYKLPPELKDQQQAEINKLNAEQATETNNFLSEAKSFVKSIFTVSEATAADDRYFDKYHNRRNNGNYPYHNVENTNSTATEMQNYRIYQDCRNLITYYLNNGSQDNLELIIKKTNFLNPKYKERLINDISNMRNNSSSQYEIDLLIRIENALYSGNRSDQTGSYHGNERYHNRNREREYQNNIQISDFQLDDRNSERKFDNQSVEMKSIGNNMYLLSYRVKRRNTMLSAFGMKGGYNEFKTEYFLIDNDRSKIQIFESRVHQNKIIKGNMVYSNSNVRGNNPVQIGNLKFNIRSR